MRFDAILFSSRVLFGLYLVGLLLVPMMFGSAIPAAWGGVVAWFCLIACLWITGWQLGWFEVTKSFYKSRSAWFVLLIWLGWQALQLLPMPNFILGWLSPTSLYTYSVASDIGAGNGSYPISQDLWSGENRVLLTISYFCVFGITLLMVNSKRRLMLLIWTLLLSGLFQSLYGMAMVMTGEERIFFYEKSSGQTGLVTGTYINRNHLAGYLVICLSLGVGMMVGMLRQNESSSWRSRARGWLAAILSPKFYLRLSLVVMVIALVMTRSRMGNIAFFVALLGAAILGLIWIKSARRSLTLLVSSLVMIDLIIIGTWFGMDKVIDRFKDSLVVDSVGHVSQPLAYQTSEGAVSLPSFEDERGEVYKDTYSYWLDYWLSGSGIGSFKQVYPAYRGEGVGDFYEHAHNDYLELLVEGGVPSLLLLLVIIFALYTALNALRYRQDQFYKGIALGAVMSIIAMMIHETVDFNLQIPANAMTFMVVLAISYLSASLSRER